MASKNKTIQEVEKLLQDLGTKIEILIEKGKEVTGEAGNEIDKKIEELKINKEDLERDFQNRKKKFEQMYENKKREMDPKFQKSSNHFREALNQLNAAIKALFEK